MLNPSTPRRLLLRPAPRPAGPTARRDRTALVVNVRRCFVALTLLIPASACDRSPSSVPVTGSDPSTPAFYVTTSTNGPRFLKLPDQETVYLFVGGDGYGIPTWDTFVACSGGRSDMIETVSSLPGPVIGTLPKKEEQSWLGSNVPVKTAESGAVFVTTGCLRSWVSLDVYQSRFGGDWSRLQTVNTTALDGLPSGPSARIPVFTPGTLIMTSDNAQIRQVAAEGIGYDYPSAAVLSSHCRLFRETVQVEGWVFDQFPQGGVMEPATACAIVHPEVWNPGPATNTLYRPADFWAATVWMNIVQHRGIPDWTEVEIDWLRLWARVGGSDVLIAEDDVGGTRGLCGGLFIRDPWFEDNVSTPLPQTVTATGAILRPHEWKDRVAHPFLCSQAAVPQETEYVWAEARVRIDGGGLVQVGSDWWKYVGAEYAGPEVNNREGPISRYRVDEGGGWIIVSSRPM